MGSSSAGRNPFPFWVIICKSLGPSKFFRSFNIFTKATGSWPFTGPMYESPSSSNKAPGVSIPLAWISAFLANLVAAGIKRRTVFPPCLI